MQSGNTKYIWELLNTVPDPEIPVISVVELGVIRDIVFNDDNYIITITPTYSGCPAVKTFQDDIKTCLIENNITNFELKIVYAPAWTTDWMTNETKEKLRKFGIAPPSDIVICPQCNSKNTTLISEFGATACKSLFKCIDCLEPFEFFKCI
ncbi:MAG: phenylacetate-CoA oxygenase subunit PaaJ [Flavobacteriales bacterium]|jgi:ring-1,2-phenylacetyl-CoA epoxidase subunit PaaD|nr:phenylacetate-CoA oxygenase subunit PaaJ [Flavobacteriales bacterium]